MRIALRAHRAFAFLLPFQPAFLHTPPARSLSSSSSSSSVRSLSSCSVRSLSSCSVRSLSASKTLTPSSVCCTAMDSRPHPVKLEDTIHLSDKEKRIFGHLLGTISHCNLQTQLRVAGGWVRDKILGKECYDIDIAIDNMLGREFCEKVAEYLSSIGEETRGAGVVPCNPEQSKHLETATMQICDVWVDFVNLRAEDYSENSRIPTMRFGSPEEDAYRRDLTINSLFYNINTGLVEDLTGRGVADLKAGKIVTPLPPKETFLDDPLRVLRAIRFGARFNFALDGELMLAGACDDVKSALAQKISRERIGHEVDLMVSGNQAVKAMTYICDLKLFWTVFSLPPNVEPSPAEECNRICVAYMGAAWRLVQLIGFSTFSDEQRKLCLYAALFLPLRKTVYKDNKSKKISIVSHMFRNSLKLKSSYSDNVMDIHRALDKFIEVISLVSNNEDDIQVVNVNNGREFFDDSIPSRLRVIAGLLLREIKGSWRVALLVCTLLYPSSTDSSPDILDKNIELEKRKDIFSRIEHIICQLGLDKVWEVKPLVNGREIMSVMQLKTGGPVVSEWQKKVVEWQLAHPSGTAEECLEWVREMYSKRVKLV